MKRNETRRAVWTTVFGILFVASAAGSLPAREVESLRGRHGEARGETRIEVDRIGIRGDGLPAGVDVSVRIADDKGILVEVRKVKTSSGGEIEIEIQIEDLPHGAVEPKELRGREVEVVGDDGTVLLDGSFAREAERTEVGIGSGALKSPVVGPFPSASGRIRLKAKEGRHSIEVKVRGLAEGTVYMVRILPVLGDAEALGTLTTQGGGNGALRVDTDDGGSLPLGAASAGELSGLTVQVVDAAGTVVLEGIAPALGENEDAMEFHVEVEFELAATAGSPEDRMRGDVNLKTDSGKHRVRVRIDRATAGAAYTASIRRSDAATGDPIGSLTAGSDGKAELEKLGKDVLPLGALSIAELEGAVVEVADSEGRIVLDGTVPSVVAPPAPPPQAPRLSFTVKLARPEPPVLSMAHGAVEFEEEEDEHMIEVEAEDLVPGATFRVELRDAAGAAEALVEGPADAAGGLRKRIDFLRSERLPFGAVDFRAYDGFTLAVLDGEGHLVLSGAVVIPATGGGGALPDDVVFRTVGSFDMAFLRGDSDRSGNVNITDVIVSLEALFRSGAIPVCLDAMDANDDGAVDISDPIHSLFFLFIGGVETPFPGSLVGGFDPTPDGLFCRS